MMYAAALHEQNGVPYYIAIIISVLLSDLVVEFREVMSSAFCAKTPMIRFKRKNELTKRRTHPKSLDHQLLVAH